MNNFRQGLAGTTNVIGLINLLGGLLLTIVLGSQAWEPTKVGRKYRLCAGSLAVGLIPSYFFCAWFSDLLAPLVENPPARSWIAFIAFPILLLVVSFYFDSLRARLERGTKTG